MRPPGAERPGPHHRTRAALPNLQLTSPSEPKRTAVVSDGWRWRRYVRACRRLAGVSLAAAAGRIEPAEAVGLMHEAYRDVLAVVGQAELRVAS